MIERRPADEFHTAGAKRFREKVGKMSPEEWAARNGHRLGNFGFAAYRYADPELDDFIQRLRAALSSIEEHRQRFLTQEERDQIAKEIADPNFWD